ncbi:hypothetical protein ACLOJK_033315, partial [Asimina triloba]
GSWMDTIEPLNEIWIDLEVVACVTGGRSRQLDAEALSKSSRLLDFDRSPLPSFGLWVLLLSHVCSARE